MLPSCAECKQKMSEIMKTRVCPLTYVGVDLGEFIYHRDGHKCVMCGSIRSVRIDHIIPISKGGHPANPHNLQLLCYVHSKSKYKDADKVRPADHIVVSQRKRV